MAMTLDSLTASALNIGILIFSTIFGGAIIAGGVWWYGRYRKYREFICRIWERDGFGQLCETEDKAGIFVDRSTQNKRFFMKRYNVGLNPDNIPYVPKGAAKIVYMLRTGLKNFQFIKPTVSNPNVYLTVGEEDVNWAINAYDRQKKVFGQNWLEKYLPFISIVFTGTIILLMVIYVIKNFSVLKEVAITLKETAQILVQGTVIK